MIKILYCFPYILKFSPHHSSLPSIASESLYDLVAFFTSFSEFLIIQNQTSPTEIQPFY